MNEKDVEARAKAEGFAMGVRWARRRFGEAIAKTLNAAEMALMGDTDWILGVNADQNPKPYSSLQWPPLTDKEVQSMAADMEQASKEDTDIPF